MAKLVDVYSSSKQLKKRQLPLVVDESLTMVMDMKAVGMICDIHHVKAKAKELEELTRKVNMMSERELDSALQITHSDLLHVLNQSVPCVGCRRSVERLYYQLFTYGYSTLDPIVVRKDGIITICSERPLPQILCSLFHGHADRLNDLMDNQIKRNKKSHRCVLHSLDSQRSRAITPAWREVWDCMHVQCRRDVCIIDASSLHATLETYLRKHRFCGECRTKVLKAYNLLIVDEEPCKEKGYVAALYNGIKRCLQEKHIHLQVKTEYITDLIQRAEPELIGSRRERHAKTLEIAQEEVLTCLGICMYERLHRIYIRMREEECTCQVFAAVAVDALCRNFETSVERVKGVSQMELLCAELTKEEQQKQLRREQKKLKRKRKKADRMADLEGKEECSRCNGSSNGFEDLDKTCTCTFVKLDNSSNCKTCCELVANGNGKLLCAKCCKGSACEKEQCNSEGRSECKCSSTGSGGSKEQKSNNKKHSASYKYDNYLPPTNDYAKGGNGSSSDHSHDCGYSSENNNGCCETGSVASSLLSSPEGSEVACSDGCCQLDTDYLPHSRLSLSYGFGPQLSLQEMLEDQFYCEDDSDCYITAEEVMEFQSNNRQVDEKRQQLRQTLQERFAQLCVNGPLHVPRILAQTKYASN